MYYGGSLPEPLLPPHIALAVPGTAAGRTFLPERSHKPWLDSLACPLLVIQSRNDSRMVAKESGQLVNDLKKKGKDIEILLFEDKGFDVLKYANRVTCYNAFAGFFVKYL